MNNYSEDNNLQNSNNSGNLSDNLLNGYNSTSINQKDIDAIKNRSGKNESIARNKVDDEQDNSNGSSLEEKDKLEKDDKKDIESSVENQKEDKRSIVNPKQMLENATGITELKNKWLKLKLQIKIALIVGAVALTFLLLVAFFSAIIAAMESFTNAVVSFFGVSEVDTSENANDGLYTSDKFLYDENGNEISAEGLVKKLDADYGCKMGGWYNFTDWLSGDDFNGNECKFIRYIKSKTEDEEHNNVHAAPLVISTIFYGYDMQPSNSEYNNKNAIPNDLISADKHYETLKRVLTDNNNYINKKTVDEIIEAGFVNNKQYYYEWSIEEDSNGNKVGKCEKKFRSNKEYNINKWKIFMRYGSDEANRYDEQIASNYSYESSSEECNGSKSESELLQLVKLSGDANSYSVDLSQMENNNNTTYNNDIANVYADIDSKTKDNLGSLDYRTGFAYTHFPAFEKAINDPNINIEYDDIFTPKIIESTINDIISKSSDIASVLLMPNEEDNYNYSNNYGSVITGAYCADYLKTPLSQMQVKLVDCHSNYLKTVSFEDYIIGVANAEVSNKNDNYVLSEMLAAISYALKRRNNYTKGSTITMKSGTCDQAYCSPKEGCTVKNNPEICKGCMSFYIGGSRGKSPKLYNKYKELYSIASEFLVVSNGKVHNAHYVSTIQNQWYKKATQGMSFTQIIQETYEKEGAQVIRCSNPNSSLKVDEIEQPQENIVKVGSDSSVTYPEVSADNGKFYGYSYNEKTGTDISINPLWIDENITTISPNCSDAQFASKQFRVHKGAVSNFQQAFNGICTLLTTGVTLSDGTTCKYTMDDLKDGSTFVEKKSINGFDDLHSYGIAQDWNYSSKYNVLGVEYRPFSSNSTLENYFDFVEAINTESNSPDRYNEEHCKNINYILYKYAYEPAGFSWGYSSLLKTQENGTFVTGSFSGKTFVLNY